MKMSFFPPHSGHLVFIWWIFYALNLIVTGVRQKWPDNRDLGDGQVAGEAFWWSAKELQHTGKEVEGVLKVSHVLNGADYVAHPSKAAILLACVANVSTSVVRR